MAYLRNFVILLFFVGSVSSDPCFYELNCTCSNSKYDILVHANCSGLHLNNSPSWFPDNVTSIDLSRNQLQTINITPNYPRTLKHLNLSYNDINYLSNKSFDWIPYLETLDLSYNNLNLGKESLPDGVFQYLGNLKSLNLSHNNFSHANQYNAEIFQNIPLLETLEIDGLTEGNFKFTLKRKRFAFTKSSDDFNCSPDLKSLCLKFMNVLVVSGRRNPSKCLIEVLTADFFASLPTLKKLDLSGCSIKSIEEGSFPPSLTYLDLSYNEKLSFHLLPNISANLINLTTLILDKIHCTFGMGTYITADMVKNFANTSIKNLSLSMNRLESVEPNVLTNTSIVRKLEYLNLSYNKLTFGWYLLNLGQMKKMKKIDLSGQHTTFFTGSGTDFKECENHRICSYSSPDLGYSTPHRWNLTIYMPPELETVIFNHASLHSAIEKVVISSNNSVKNIDLGSNYIENLTGPVHGLDKVEVVDFSHNFISVLSPYFFPSFPKMTKLNLGQNLLGNCLNNDNSTYFRNLTNLKDLDLSKNVIRSISPENFDGLDALEVLNLSYNLLSDFYLNEGQVSSLKLVDLSFNALSSISDTTTKALESIQRNHQLKINLTGNDLRCTCDALDLLKWMVKSEITFVDKHLYSCRTKNMTQESMTDLDLIVKTLVKKCDDYEEIIGIISALYVVFLTLIVGGILYRYRWKLRYIYYMSKWNTATSRDTYSKMYQYDAFVSYADEEKDFVMQEMTSELERASQLVLCLHERDFTPGKSIGENITRSICSSKRVLCIVSESFLRSHWCMYELEMALTDNRYSRDKPSVFLIMYRGLPTENSKISLSIRLMSLVKMNAYIEYPKDDRDKVEFWNSLRVILQE
ncbi:toll-like receptor 4 [Ostrea edulis]|uniref:toll-like receptor 4 n=1 Tax=Ostrea edulis TaxID=37623 RepID=UPI0024AEA054|nr:toll-like receptor 4 [Ostrea edulis]